jgi:GH15 family glucan-1,4-alpha-glucosidase
MQDGQSPEMLDQARLLFERMLGYANHLGLHSEQTSSQGRRGNFPQAFTHLALISAAFNLDRALSRRDASDHRPRVRRIVRVYGCQFI